MPPLGPIHVTKLGFVIQHPGNSFHEDFNYSVQQIGGIINQIVI